jgi:hypothetical protein
LAKIKNDRHCMFNSNEHSVTIADLRVGDFNENGFARAFGGDGGTDVAGAGGAKNT